jgi:nucleoside-diphosphate-sugar epimerase
MTAANAPQKIALIGGSGFIGSVLTPVLQSAGHSVRILDIVQPSKNLPVEYAAADVRNLEELREAVRGCDIIVNLAAAHRDDIRPLSLYHDTNVLGAANVCEAAERNGIETILFTSSVAIYGMQDGEPNEEAPARPFNAYGRTKWEAEAIYRAWQTASPEKRKLQIVRPTVVFGPGNRGNVYNLIAQLASGLFVMVGDGTNRKSMAYVGNVAAFLFHLIQMEQKSGISIYNYCDKPDFTMNELLAVVRKALGRPEGIPVRISYGIGIAAGSVFDVIARVSGRSLPISRVRVQKFCANTVFKAERLRETGFVAPFDLARGLLDTINTEFRDAKVLPRQQTSHS